MPIPKISSADLDDLAVLVEIAADEEHDAGYDGDDSSDDEMARPELNPTDILKHYWTKGNVKYTYAFYHHLHYLFTTLTDTRLTIRVCHAGRKYYMTAEAMHVRFRGVPHAILKFWERKRPSSISSTRIMEYFSIQGHIGPFREPLYRFLARRIQRLLKEDKSNFFF